MGLFSKIFGSGDKIVIVDLTKPYRDLLSGQTDPIVRGVILRAIKSMDELQYPSDSERALLGKEIDEEMKKRLVAIQRQQLTRTTNDTALSAINLAVCYIMEKAGMDVLVGNSMVIRDVSGANSLKNAAMWFAFGIFISGTIILDFVRSGVISGADEFLRSEIWKSNLLAHFVLASPEQKTEILHLGSKMFKDLNERREENVVKFLENTRQLITGAAINWEKRKLPEDEIMGAFKSQLDVLLGALE